MNSDVATWKENENFQLGLQIANDLQVVNDTAERAVHMTEEYSGILTKNEIQRQYLFQEVTEHRKDCPDVNKASLVKRRKIDD